jgi:hypothetical protein
MKKVNEQGNRHAGGDDVSKAVKQKRKRITNVRPDS